MDKEVAIECEEERVRPAHSEVNRLICDNQTALQLIGWQPTVYLEEGLTKTIEWFKQTRQAYKSDVYNI